MKTRIAGMLLVFLIMLASMMTLQAQDDYTPMTDEEVDAYLASITIEELREDIRKLDYIEHATPEIIFPPVLYILSNEDLFIYYEDANPVIVIAISPYLEYWVPVTNYIARDFMPDNTNQFLRKFGWFTLGALVGASTNFLSR